MEFRNKLGLAGILFIIATLTFIAVGNSQQNSCKENINFDIALKQKSLAHNYLLIFNRKDQIMGKLEEQNNFLLLELLMDRMLQQPQKAELENYFELFDRKLDKYGWWPNEYIETGKKYFLTDDTVKLHYDSMDTALVYKLQNRKIDDIILKHFLSNTPLPAPFNKACSDISCQKNQVVRVWDNPNWYADIDLVIAADFITALNLQSQFAKDVFNTNKKLINYVIENHEVEDYFKYFEPKVTGYFSLLMLNDVGPSFLTKKAKNILLQKFQNSATKLELEPLSSPWGGGNEYFYDCRIVHVNERIPSQMIDYAKKYWVTS